MEACILHLTIRCLVVEVVVEDLTHKRRQARDLTLCIRGRRRRILEEGWVGVAGFREEAVGLEEWEGGRRIRLEVLGMATLFK